MTAQAVCYRVIYHTLCLVHEVLRLSHIDETAGYDIRSCKKLVAITFQSQDYDDDTVLCQVLTVTQDDVSYIADTKAVYQDTAMLDMVYHFAGILADLHNIAGRHDQNIFLRHTHCSRDRLVCH